MKKEIFVFKSSILIAWIMFLSIISMSYYELFQSSYLNSNKMNLVLYSLVILYTISFIFFSFILFNINKLLNKNIAEICSKSSIPSINIMINLSKIMAFIHFISIPLFYIIGEVDDAPGVIIIGLILFAFPIILLSIASFIKKIIIQIKNK